MTDRGASHADPLQDAASASQLQLIYETAPIGLAFLSTDCRYILINQHLTEICGISIAEHIGRTVRETVPKVAEQVEQLVQTIVRTGEPITGIDGCCACPAIGQVAAAPPNKAMNSRRRMTCPQRGPTI